MEVRHGETKEMIYQKMGSQLFDQIYLLLESEIENKKWISKPVSEVEDNNNELISETCEKRDFLKNCKKRVYTYKTICEFKLVTAKKI